MKELREGSLGGDGMEDAADAAAVWQARDLDGKHVRDVNGVEVGTVTRCFGEQGLVIDCDVTLADSTRRSLGVADSVAHLPADWIASVDPARGEVRLRKTAFEVTHAREVAEAGTPRNEGARGPPRKIR